MQTNSNIGSSTNSFFEAGSKYIGREEERPESFPRTALWVLLSSACYYLATQIAWALCFPNSKVSLFFPPHAVLVSALLLVPTRHWWAYTLGAVGGHFLATQQAHWPFFYSLHCEAFDAVQNVATAAGLRIFIKSPLKLITLRDAIVFVLIAAFLVPFGTAFWGAAFTISNHFGTHYWVEWRNLGISNAVTAIVLVPAILLGVHQLTAQRIKVTPARALEGCLLGAGLLTVGVFAFDHLPAGPDTSPAVLYAPIPLLVWAALRFGLGGTSASMVIITFLAIWGTMHGNGPFLMQSPAGNALALQMFLLFTATPLIFLAVLFEEEKRTQAALRESEARFRTIAKSVPVLIWMAGTDKLCSFVNKGWLDYTGRTLEQELGAGWAEGIHPEDADRGLRAYTKSFEARREFRMEHRLRRRDGEYGWVLNTGVPRFAHDGTFIGYIGSCVDITDRKRAEEASRNLAHATRMSTMGALAGSLAHELNQPLTAILSNAQAGSRFLAEPSMDVAEVREALQDIAQDAKRAGEVIRQLRTLVKREDLRFAELELHHLVQDVVRLLHSDTVIRKVRIVLDFDKNPHSVRGDAVQLQQVILNLVLNAFDAMKDIPESERAVCIRTRPANGSEVQVEVSDRGTGIHPERLARLFEPFQTTKQEGLGLGLAISRTIVEAHGGRLWGINNPDRGATFCFTMPFFSATVNSV